jgi:EmrB/QacA subfamily drug resistance transporter
LGLLLAIFLAALDQTVVSVALLTIARDLGQASLMAWLISGYLVAATVTAPLYGKLSDMRGRRPMLLIAVGIYICASIACALAQTMTQLLVFRVLQGVGGGGLLVLCHAAIADVVPGAQRGRYQGYFSGMFAMAALAGPVVGGLLAQYLSWRAVFWLNVPLGLLAWIMVYNRLRGLEQQLMPVRIDVAGAALLTVGLLLLLIALARVGQGVPWGATSTVAAMIGGVLTLALFVLVEARAAAPIIAPALMQNRPVALCCGILALMFFVLFGCAVMLPLSMQAIEHLNPAEVAIRMLPHTLAAPLGSFLSGRWMLRVSSVRSLILAGGGLTLLGMGLIDLHLWALGHQLLVPDSTAAVSLHVLGTVVAGFGLGLTMPACVVTVQSSVAKDQIGIATAISSFFRQLGGAVGIAVLTSLMFLALAPLIEASQMAGQAEGSAAQVLLELSTQDNLPEKTHGYVQAGFHWAFELSMLAALLAFLLGQLLPARFEPKS